jgi:hypothetical protein
MRVVRFTPSGHGSPGKSDFYGITPPNTRLFQIGKVRGSRTVSTMYEYGSKMFSLLPVLKPSFNIMGRQSRCALPVLLRSLLATHYDANRAHIDEARTDQDCATENNHAGRTNRGKPDSTHAGIKAVGVAR